MTLISIGGVIGAGLFVGSGLINSAGPAAVLSFLAAGIRVILIMRMLAEMTTAQPALGSFYAYARAGLGRRAGFAVGWLYWYFWVIVVAVEAVAGGRILQLWLPGIPLWTLGLGLMAPHRLEPVSARLGRTASSSTGSRPSRSSRSSSSSAWVCCM